MERQTTKSLGYAGLLFGLPASAVLALVSAYMLFKNGVQPACDDPALRVDRYCDVGRHEVMSALPFLIGLALVVAIMIASAWLAWRPSRARTE